MHELAFAAGEPIADLPQRIGARQLRKEHGDFSGCPRCGEPVLRLDPERPEVLYVGAGTHGVYQSSNGGRTFHPMNAGLESAAIASLLVDPADSAKLYAGVAQQGVFKWSARHQAWIPLNAGLPVQDFRGVVALDPQHPVRGRRERT